MLIDSGEFERLELNLPFSTPSDLFFFTGKIYFSLLFSAMNNLPTKSCLACNKILKGRIDKKFCDDYCRNLFNNQQKADSTNYTRNIINVLRKNKRILSGFLGEDDMVKMSKDRLLSQGFHFKYHTHTYENKKGAVYVYCFEVGYLPLENDWMLLVRRGPEKD